MKMRNLLINAMLGAVIMSLSMGTQAGDGMMKKETMMEKEHSMKGEMMEKKTMSEDAMMEKKPMMEENMMKDEGGKQDKMMKKM